MAHHFSWQPAHAGGRETETGREIERLRGEKGERQWPNERKEYFRRFLWCIFHSRFTVHLLSRSKTNLHIWLHCASDSFCVIPVFVDPFSSKIHGGNLFPLDFLSISISSVLTVETPIWVRWLLQSIHHRAPQFIVRHFSFFLSFPFSNSMAFHWIWCLSAFGATEDSSSLPQFTAHHQITKSNKSTKNRNYHFICIEWTECPFDKWPFTVHTRSALFMIAIFCRIIFDSVWQIGDRCLLTSLKC